MTNDLLLFMKKIVRFLNCKKINKHKTYNYTILKIYVVTIKRLFHTLTCANKSVYFSECNYVRGKLPRLCIS